MISTVIFWPSTGFWGVPRVAFPMSVSRKWFPAEAGTVTVAA